MVVACKILEFGEIARDLPDDAQTDENDHFMSHATGIRNFRIRNFDWWLI